MRHIFALCLALMLPLTAAQAQSNPHDTAMRHYTAEYRLYLAGVLLSVVDLHLSLGANAYRLSAHIGPAGIGHILSDSHVVTTTKGSISGATFVPARLDLAWSNDDGIKSTYMEYNQGAPVTFHSGYKLPPEAQPKNKVDIDSVGRGSVDPFLAMLAPLRGNTLASACNGKIRVFDGRRLASLTAANPTAVAASAHDYVAPIPLVACSIVWQPIAGYSERSMTRASDLPPIEAHFGRIADTAYAAPLDMKAETRYGNISLYAVRYFEPVTVLPPPFDINDYVYDEIEDE